MPLMCFAFNDVITAIGLSLLGISIMVYVAAHPWNSPS